MDKETQKCRVGIICPAGSHVDSFCSDGFGPSKVERTELMLYCASMAGDA
jgi:hypothetical protein